MKKIPFSVNKHNWHPGIIPGPIVLISTHDKSGSPNVAPKSWIQMVSFEPSILMFSGTKGNSTETNILETGCFSVNIVNSAMAEKVFDCIRWHGTERIEKAELTLFKAQKITAPLIDQCPAHLECKLIDTKEAGSGFIILGEIVAASIRADIAEADRNESYRLLDQIVFLEDRLYSHIRSIPVCDNNDLDD